MAPGDLWRPAGFEWQVGCLAMDCSEYEDFFCGKLQHQDGAHGRLHIVWEDTQEMSPMTLLWNLSLSLIFDCK